MKTKILRLYSVLILYVFLFGLFRINVYAFNPMIQEKISEDEILIDKKIEIKSDFSWSFLPLFFRAEKGNLGLGYFLPTGVYRAPKGRDLLQADKIAFSRYTVSGETLLEDVEARYQNYCKGKEDAPALILHDGSTQIDEIIRLDLGEDDHWLYLKNNDEVYQLYGNVKTAVWQRFLEDFTDNSGVKFAGSKIWNGIFNELTIFNEDYLNNEGGTLSIVSFKETEPLPEFETEEEMLEYFRQKYPQMNAYEVYPVEFDDIYGDNRDKMYDDVFRIISAENCNYGYYTRNGTAYEVRYEGTDIKIWPLRSQAGYDYNKIFTWVKDEDGNISRRNLVSEEYYLMHDVGNGVPLSFYIKRDREIEIDTEIGESVYSIEIYKNDETKPFQVIREASAEWNPFSFEDFNADGYSDLFINYYYGANGGTASHYLWSPTNEQFVKVPEELEYYGFYNVDPKTRRLYMHHHGSAVSGTETTYQWSNEVDYEVIKYFSHDSVWTEAGAEDLMEVIIKEYDGNKEIVLTQYIYTQDEYDAEMDFIWGSYYADFTWEKEVTSPDTKEKYVLRYAQDFLRDDNGEILPNACVAELYVYNSDTRIVNRLVNESTASYSQILWQDANNDGEKELIIQYEDGTQVNYTWKQLLYKEES